MLFVSELKRISVACGQDVCAMHVRAYSRPQTGASTSCTFETHSNSGRDGLRLDVISQDLNGTQSKVVDSLIPDAP